jgi:hypothetical protein
MKFNSQRFCQLAGIRETPTAPAAQPVPAQGRSLNESKASPMSADERRLRDIIRAEARRMIAERTGGTSVESIQSKRSLTEAIALGFAGIGFGGKANILGGPFTSARTVMSTQVNEAEEPDESDEDEDDESDDEAGEADESGEDEG